MEHLCNEIDRGKPKYSGKKTCPSATLSTTNPTWTDPASNLGLRGEVLAQLLQDLVRGIHNTVFCEKNGVQSEKINKKF